LHVPAPDAGRGTVDDLGQPLAGIGFALQRRVAVDDQGALVKCLGHRVGQLGKNGALAVIEMARFTVDHAQRSHPHPVMQADRRTGIETDVGGTGDQGIVGEAFVSPRVGNFQQPVFKDGMGAESHFTRGLADTGKAMVRLEPLPVGVDQGHHADRCPGDQGSSPGQRVEQRLGPCIQDSKFM